MIKPQGALDGAKFYLPAHETEIGRKGTSTGLPFSEKGAAGVDTGRRPRRISVTCFVLGDSYAADRDALVKVIESPGPHLLTHPKILEGRMSAWIWGAKVTESTGEGRKATFTFTAEEAFDQPKVTPTLAVAASVKKFSAGGLDATSKSFSNPITGLRHATSDFVAAAHLAVLDDVLNGARAINGSISAVLSVPSGFASQIDAISRQGAQLVRTPQRMFNEIQGVFFLLAQAAGRFARKGEDIDYEKLEDPFAAPSRPGKVLAITTQALTELGDGVPPVPAVDTPERNEQRDGQLAIQRHMRAAGLFHWADAAADAPYDSAGDAAKARDAIVDGMIALSQSEPDMDPDVVASLRSCAAALSAHLTQVSGALPRVVQHTPADTIPVEVIAWQLYADAERSDEIVLHNLDSIRSSSAVRGGRPIEVKAT